MNRPQTKRQQLSKSLDAGKLGVAITQWRTANGLTQRQLALLLGWHQPYVWRVEHGEVQPTLTTVMQLSAVMGASVDELIGVMRRDAEP